MKGILKYSGIKESWYIEYEDETRQIKLDVRPGRIHDLNAVGNDLKENDVVEFIIEATHEFPYQWGIPVINPNGEVPTVASQLKYKEQYKIQLWLSGFPTDDHEIICDGYDTNSSGYWYFYNNNENGGRTYLGAFPISRTAIYEIEKIQTQY